MIRTKVQIQTELSIIYFIWQALGLSGTWFLEFVVSYIIEGPESTCYFVFVKSDIKSMKSNKSNRQVHTQLTSEELKVPKRLSNCTGLMKSKWLNELNSDWSWCIDFIGEAFPLDGVKLKDLSHGIIYLCHASQGLVL